MFYKLFFDRMRTKFKTNPTEMNHTQTKPNSKQTKYKPDQAK